jgi:hypothetical protein
LRWIIGCCLLSALGVAEASTVSSESSVGLAADYNSNPYLGANDATAAESVALVANVPITYNSDALSLELVPRVREAESRGDAELLTNYQYLDGDWHLASDRNTFSAAGSWHRDSTFYNIYENAELRGRNLPRLEETAELGWQRALNERSDLGLTGFYDQVDFSAQSGLRLNNYRYGQGSAQYDLSLTERWTSTTSAGFGRYDLPEQNSSNENRFVQTSLSRALSEQWSAMAEVGYSRVNSSSVAYLCCAIVPVSTGFVLQLVPVKQSSSGGIVSYALSLDRKIELWSFDLSASRSVQPSGLGELLTQDSAKLTLTRQWTERLSVDVEAQSALQTDTLRHLGDFGTRYYAFGVDANWQCGEHWVLTLQTAYDINRIEMQPKSAGSAVVGLTLTRQLGRLRL